MSEEVLSYGDAPTYIVEPPRRTVRIRIKRLRDDVTLPAKATPQSVGYDLFMPYDFCVDHQRHVIPLGFAIELPDGIEAKIEARSGFSSKGVEGFALREESINRRGESSDTQLWQRIDKAECFDADVLTGKVDPDYRGEVGVIIRNNDMSRPFLIAKGTRIAQMTFYPVAQPDSFETVDELSATERADGGFGHSGI